ncbi:MAG: hypothetical protein DI601_09470 [Azospirillum brasilense]|nr:MAG: hypothetical protein DI601_09470 [Azospirillum brasilense]
MCRAALPNHAVASGLLPRRVRPMLLLPLLLAGCGMPGQEAATAPENVPVAGEAPKLSVGGYMGAAYSHTR